MVEPAKQALRGCSTYKPPNKKSARANQRAEEARVRLAALYPEPMVVKVRYLSGSRFGKDYGHYNPSYFYPTRIEEYPV